MIKNKKTEINKTKTNNMKSCKYCRNGNCKFIKIRNTLQNFTNVSYCGKTMNVIQYTKFSEV